MGRGWKDGEGLVHLVGAEDVLVAYMVVMIKVSGYISHNRDWVSELDELKIPDYLSITWMW